MIAVEKISKEELELAVRASVVVLVFHCQQKAQ